MNDSGKPSMASLVLSSVTARLIIHMVVVTGAQVAPPLFAPDGSIAVLCPAAERPGSIPHEFRGSRRPHRVHTVSYSIPAYLCWQTDTFLSH